MSNNPLLHTFGACCAIAWFRGEYCWHNSVTRTMSPVTKGAMYGFRDIYIIPSTWHMIAGIVLIFCTHDLWTRATPLPSGVLYLFVACEHISYGTSAPLTLVTSSCVPCGITSQAEGWVDIRDFLADADRFKQGQVSQSVSQSGTQSVCQSVRHSVSQSVSQSVSHQGAGLTRKLPHIKIRSILYGELCLIIVRLKTKKGACSNILK